MWTLCLETFKSAFPRQRGQSRLGRPSPNTLRAQKARPRDMRARLARSVGERDHHLVVEEPELFFETGKAVDPSP